MQAIFLFLFLHVTGHVVPHSEYARLFGHVRAKVKVIVIIFSKICNNCIMKSAFRVCCYNVATVQPMHNVFKLMLVVGR